MCRRVEKRERRRDSRGRVELWWINAPGNEPWDLEVYNFAAFLFCMQGAHSEKVWRDREQIYGKVQQLTLLDDGATVRVSTPEPDTSKTDATQTPAAPLIKPPPRTRRGGFVTRWR